MRLNAQLLVDHSSSAAGKGRHMLPHVNAVHLGPTKVSPAPEQNPPSPTLILPAGACDSHCHVFGPIDRFPYPRDAAFRPPEAGVTTLRALHDVLGIQRAVIVHSMAHGTDHAPMLEALRQSDGKYRGVGVLTPQQTASQLAEFADAGVCGLRIHFLPHLGGIPPQETIDRVSTVAARHNWHIEIHVAGSGIADYADQIAAFEQPVVIDHMARLDLGTEEAERGLDALLKLLTLGHVWVKVSGVERITKQAPPFADAVEIARTLVHEAPDRTVWGTDFPHPNLTGWLPSNASLVDLLSVIAPSEDARHRLLVANPTELFGF